METVQYFATKALSALQATLALILGGFDSLLLVLIFFVFLDYVSGVLLAAVHKKLSSEVGYKGIAKKVFIFIIIALASITDSYILHLGNSLRTLTVIFYLANEALSVLENAERMGIPLPEKLKNALRQLGDQDLE